MPAITEIEKRSLESLHPAREMTGQLFVCDIRLYKTLFNQLLQKSGGDLELAKKYTHQAITNDGIGLVQENISALKDDKGNFIVSDLELQTSMQQTPTKHVYYQTKDQNTGKDIITSPEYNYLGASITTALTSWRRGNDRAAMGLVENLALNQAPDSTFIWASPKAEEWEDLIIRKYNGEYGYLYVGHLTKEAGSRKMVVYSYKTDLKTASYIQLLAGTHGQFYQAPFENNSDKAYNRFDKTPLCQSEDVGEGRLKLPTLDTLRSGLSFKYRKTADSKSAEAYKDPVSELKDGVNFPQRPLLDNIMRTVAIIKGHLSGSNIISRIYQSKKEVEGKDRVFNILEQTMHFYQNPALRERIELEVSISVADWLTDQIINGIPDGIIQDQIRDKYIFYTQALIRKIKYEELQALLKQPQYKVEASSIVDEKVVYREDLRRMTELKGAFCGGWGTKSLLDDPPEDLKNYSGISGAQLTGGGFTKETDTCKICKINSAVQGGCGYCKSCEHKAA